MIGIETPILAILQKPNQVSLFVKDDRNWNKKGKKLNVLKSPYHQLLKLMGIETISDGVPMLRSDVSLDSKADGNWNDEEYAGLKTSFMYHRL